MTVSLLRRLGAVLYDGLLVVSIVFIANLWTPALPDAWQQHPVFDIVIWLYSFAIGFLFFGWFWTHQGQTVGMKAWKFRVLNQRGEIIDWKAALMRYLTAIISWSLLGSGFLWALFRSDKATLHDLWSKTYLERMD